MTDHDWRVILTPDARVPMNINAMEVLARKDVCPCMMGILLMRDTLDGCSCTGVHSPSEAWALVDRAITTGLFSHA